MNLQENNHPLDELFRQHFNSLPPEPGASGWDTPSERVWQGVRAGIKPVPKSGIGNTLLWGSAVTIMVGSVLVWAFLSRPNPKNLASPPVEMAPITTPIAEPDQPIDAPVTTANEIPIKTEIKKTTTKPIRKPEAMPDTAPNSTEKDTPVAPHNSRAGDQRLKPGSSLPLPGTTTEPHNTTEKKKKAGG